MNGYVVPDDDAETYRFFGFGVVSPKDVRQAIADNPAGDADARGQFGRRQHVRRV